MTICLSCTNSQHENREREIANKEQLKSACLVCRLGNGYFSKLFRQYASKEQRFSHIGIISVERDTLFVYHAEASELTGIGFVKRETLGSFLYGINTYSFFKLNYPDSTKSKIIENVKSYHARKTSFDMSFDNQDDTELYCTELIAVSINHALNRDEVKPSLKVKKKRFYTLDDIYRMKNVEEFVLNK